MIRTSCSVKPRVVIFHISASKEEIETQLRSLFMRRVWNNLRLLTRSDLVIVVREYARSSGLYFQEGELAYFWGIRRCSFGGLKQLYFLTISTCLRPKKRASIDQAPGPIIAKLTPNPQTMIGVHGSAGPKKTSHRCLAATRRPTYGVPNPITRRTDAINCNTIVAKLGLALDCRNASRKRKVPMRNLWIRRPMPGHPAAKVENKRCTIEVKIFAIKAPRAKGGSGSPPFRGFASR